MKPSPFHYHRPATVEEAVRLLAELRAGGADAKVLAGGQSLVPLMSMRLAAPGHLVDINHLPGLDRVEVTAGEVRVGALARHRTVERDDAAYAACPLLRRALVHVAHPAIRNRGTTVGSIVHADPAGEMTAVLAVLGGRLELVSTSGTRQVAAETLFTGPMTTTVRTDELAVAALFPVPPAGTGSAFVELARRSGDYALCGVAALVTVDADLAVTGARLGLISVGPMPVVVDLAPAVHGSGGGIDVAAVRALVDAAVEPDADIHASAEYRRHLAGVLSERAVGAALEDALRRRRGRSAA
ncbi:FAD binding domain-containing protein [Nocardioides mesophilus]|uniref:Xanthine dehydrogenase family protein subunit M n=1 Tax=Nocardioides mesophilus TaxID=433659 RepID=A0A7G9RAF5_9ACTN|nr:xanthine dehydrogenase family protein subunit M [Nocardioides mesophilus]QNN52580.1 xanthine dehydrogenase family protein subunit M [Nocardioides mesophilus]